jgi:exodeoxyribonuclease VII large subunit
MATRETGESARRVRRSAPGALVRELSALEHHRGRVEELGTRGVREAAATLDDRRRSLAAAGTRLTRGAVRHLEGSAARLRALDPRRVLERGYSITRDVRGGVLTSIDGLGPDDALFTELAGGAISSRIESVAPPATHEERDA